MPRTTLPIANGFYQSGSLPVSAQNCVNAYPVVEQGPSTNQETLRGTPGLVQVADNGANPCRGSHLLADEPYFVIGDTLYKLNSDETVTAISGTITGTGPVVMAENGTQLCIVVPGTGGYIYTTSGGLTAITDPDFSAQGAPTSVRFVDGYFVFTTADSKIINSNVNDGTVYDALDFGSAESTPDDVVGLEIFFNQLFVGGSRTTEGFTNTGGDAFPFTRSNLFLSQGFVSQFSVQVARNRFLFIGRGTNEQPAVWEMVGNSTEQVSTYPIDQLIGGLTPAQLAAITSWSYSQGGHYFVGWNLPGTTIVYDLTTGRWHERQSRIPDAETANTYTIQNWRCRDPIAAYGKIYAGDSESGKIVRVDLDAYTELGTEILREFTTQPFQNNMDPLFVASLELSVESGVGNEGATDPLIVLSRSRDGGRTFPYRRPRPIGKQGEYHRRTIWRRMGRADTTDVYRFEIADPVKFVGIQLTAELRAGSGQ